MSNVADADLESSFNALWKLEEPDLEIELGQRLQLTQRELEKHSALSAARPSVKVIDTTVLQGPLDSFRQIASKFLGRFEKDMYTLICDKSDPDNAAIVKLGLDPKTIGLLLAGYLTAHFAILPGIAVVLASLFAKRFVGTAYMTACDEWKVRVAKQATT